MTATIQDIADFRLSPFGRLRGAMFAEAFYDYMHARTTTREWVNAQTPTPAGTNPTAPHPAGDKPEWTAEAILRREG